MNILQLQKECSSKWRTAKFSFKTKEGKTVNGHWLDHSMLGLFWCEGIDKDRCISVNEWIKKYGENGFDFEIIAT